MPYFPYKPAPAGVSAAMAIAMGLAQNLKRRQQEELLKQQTEQQGAAKGWEQALRRGQFEAEYGKDIQLPSYQPQLDTEIPTEIEAKTPAGSVPIKAYIPHEVTGKVLPGAVKHIPGLKEQALKLDWAQLKQRKEEAEAGRTWQQTKLDKQMEQQIILQGMREKGALDTLKFRISNAPNSPEAQEAKLKITALNNADTAAKGQMPTGIPWQRKEDQQMIYLYKRMQEYIRRLSVFNPKEAQALQRISLDVITQPEENERKMLQMQNVDPILAGFISDYAGYYRIAVKKGTVPVIK